MGRRMEKPFETSASQEVQKVCCRTMKKVYVEIVQSDRSALSRKEIVKRCQKHFEEDLQAIYAGQKDFGESLRNHIDSVTIDDDDLNSQKAKYAKLENAEPSKIQIEYFVYKLNSNKPSYEDVEGHGEEVLQVATHWELPSADLHGLWDSLVYDIDIKRKLLNYIDATLLFSERRVDPLIVTFNRVVLLHGPPGTGKTSLCKALAQKMSIRLCQRFDEIQLVELDSHNLHSHWFSESGKLVGKVFSRIKDMADNPTTFVCVLVDEVESLAYARNKCSSGSEPSDALKVVNAVLTQIDHLRRYPNVLLLTTSNMNGSIDLAFVDRADIKQLIELPGPEAIYSILNSCVQELFKAEMIEPRHVLLPSNLLDKPSVQCQHSQELYAISQLARGLSGRSLRKAPLVAYSRCLGHGHSTDLATFLAALRAAVQQMLKENESFAK